MVQEGVPSEGCSASLSGSKLWVVKTYLVLETLTIQDIVFEKRFTIRPTNCHMRLGSISVAPGQLIEAGGELGRAARAATPSSRMFTCRFCTMAQSSILLPRMALGHAVIQ